MQTYPFRFVIGERVEVLGGHNQGFRAEVVALELRGSRTFASLKNEDKRVVEPEGNLKGV